MPGRMPSTADFPSSINLTVTQPPSSQPATNVLILLHGLGDTNRSFTKLGQQLNLPETACIAIQAPAPLPFGLGGFHWGEDVIFDHNTGEMDMDTGFHTSTRLVLTQIIHEGLLAKCHYQPREIIIFGYGQGGMLALQAAAAEEIELGGVISIGGFLSSSTPLTSWQRKKRTPILVCRGSKRSNVSDSSITKLKHVFECLEIKEWNRAGDNMPSNREEMMPIMQFFARRLRSMRGVPTGSAELT